jgi:CubicO group peptidase (beta-lactamase class C family)
VYAALASGGSLDGAGIVDAAALADAVTEQVYGQDLVLHRPSRFGLGFQLTQPERPLGQGQAAFGHFGAGGSLGFCDPEAGVAFGYVMNQMGPRWQNPAPAPWWMPDTPACDPYGIRAACPGISPLAPHSPPEQNWPFCSGQQKPKPPPAVARNRSGASSTSEVLVLRHALCPAPVFACLAISA